MAANLPPWHPPWYPLDPPCSLLVLVCPHWFLLLRLAMTSKIKQTQRHRTWDFQTFEKERQKIPKLKKNNGMCVPKKEWFFDLQSFRSERCLLCHLTGFPAAGLEAAIARRLQGQDLQTVSVRQTRERIAVSVGLPYYHYLSFASGLISLNPLIVM